MDENSVSFQLFLILLSFIIALGSENQISVFKQCQSKTQMSGFFLGGGEGGEREHAQKPKFGKKPLHKGPVGIYHLGWAGRIRNSPYMNFVHPPGLPSFFFEPPPQAT